MCHHRRHYAGLWPDLHGIRGISQVRAVQPQRPRLAAVAVEAAAAGGRAVATREQRQDLGAAGRERFAAGHRVQRQRAAAELPGGETLPPGGTEILPLLAGGDSTAPSGCSFNGNGC